MAPTQRPNILWIFSDQHSAHALSCYGDPNIETPHLDRLARDGVRFTNAYSTCPLCSPFRATLYTGQYIHTHGVISLFRPLLPRQPELAEVLRDAGYYTSHMGKWHLSGGDCPCHFVSPYFRPGWDEWLGWENSNDFFNTTYGVADHPKPYLTLPRYQTDSLTDLTIDWLRERKRQCDAAPGGGDGGWRPWFHVMSIEPPHGGNPQFHADGPNYAPEEAMALFRDKPLQLRPNFARQHRRAAEFERNLRGYYAQIKNLDDNVGRVLAALEETGQLDNTMIWYFSDHGDMMGSHGRAQKSRPEQESANIPLIVRYPPAIAAGRMCEAPIGAVDFMPTLLGWLGVPIPWGVQGEDLSGLLRGDGARGAESVVIQYERPYFPEAPEAAFRALRWERWMYSVFLTHGPAQLFDLDEDPFQMNNLIASPAHATTRAELRERLVQRLKDIGDDFLERADAWRS